MANDDPELQDFEEGGPEKGDSKLALELPKDLSDLLSLKPDEGAKLLLKKWKEQDKLMASRMNEWKVNRLRRRGITGVSVVKERDTKTVTVWVPEGPQIPTLNKADRLCRRVAATLFSDPAVPEALPAGDEDQDRDSADFTSRVLTDLSSESQLDDHGSNRKAFDLGSNYGSGFRHYYIDPAGNGSRPMQVVCNPAVVDLETAVQDPGEEPHVTKYVKNDGTLADEDSEDVRRQWLPRIKSELLTGKHVRFVPPSAPDVWEAQGVMIGSLRPLGDLKRIYPEVVAKLSEEQLRDLTADKPKAWRDLLPVGMAAYTDRGSNESTPGDDSLCFYVTLYMKQSKRAEDGVFYVAGGKGVFLASGTWKAEDDGELLVPVSQFKQYEDEDDPYGRGLMSLLGEGNEIRSAQIGYFLEHLDRFANRKIWLPQGANVTPQELQAATGWAVEVRGGPGGFPEVEEVPDFPRAGEKMLEFITADMDDESSLQQTAQGLDSSNVDSGIHAQRIIEQSLLGLSDIRENAIKATLRGWRITLQLVRQHYTVPQMLGWTSDDGQYRLKEWSSSDLGSTKDVRVMRGTFTSLTPSAKAATVQTMASMQAITPHEVRRMIAGTTGAIVGLEDNPHLQRVKRQISQWQDGPPDGLAEQLQQAAQMAQMQPQMPQIGPDGQPMPSPAEQMAQQALAQVFDQRPVDFEPEVAQLRTMELGRAMASTKYNRQPPWWQQGLAMAYEQARQAAGIATVAEQQQMQAQQVQQQQVAEQSKQQQQIEAKTATERLKARTALDREKMQLEARAQSGAVA